MNTGLATNIKPCITISGFASMTLLRFFFISCLTHEEWGKMAGKHNSLCAFIVLIMHLLLCFMDQDFRPHTWAVNGTLKMQIGYFGIINLKQMLKNVSFNISSELIPQSANFFRALGRYATVIMMLFENKSLKFYFIIFIIFCTSSPIVIFGTWRRFKILALLPVTLVPSNAVLCTDMLKS